ncbi:hypothetical protein ACFXTO_044568 [Malus domestica]
MATASSSSRARTRAYKSGPVLRSLSPSERFYTASNGGISSSASGFASSTSSSFSSPASAFFHQDHHYYNQQIKPPPPPSQIRFSDACQPLHLLLSVSVRPVLHRPPFDLSQPPFESIHRRLQENWTDFDAEEDLYVLADVWSRRRVGEASLDRPDSPLCAPAEAESRVQPRPSRLSAMSTADY